MNQDTFAKEEKARSLKTLIVALDFSQCSHAAFRKACDIFQGKIGRIIALHVIDSEFVKRCVANLLGKEDRIKKALFLVTKRRLYEFFEEEKRTGIEAGPVVREGIPYLEINKKAHEFKADLIIIGTCGRAVDTGRIFLGSTAEKVLRFILGFLYPDDACVLEMVALHWCLALVDRPLVGVAASPPHKRRDVA